MENQGNRTSRPPSNAQACARGRLARAGAGQASSPASAPHEVVLGAYPNPASEYTMITWPKCLQNMPWELRDLFGKRIATGRLSGASVQELELLGLPEGSYQFLVLGTDEETRIVVIH